MGIADARPRDAVTGLASALALAVVFAAAGGRIPPRWLPNASDRVITTIPHVNVAISVAAILTILSGWRAIRRGDIRRHKRAMVGATLLFAAFLVLYLYRLVLLGGPADFDGPAHVYRFVYLPVLTVHIVLAVIAVPLVFDALALASTTPVGRLGRTRHPRIGRVAATLWIVAFALGIVVYLLLYWL